VDADRVAERGKQAAREELDALELRQRPGARQQRLKPILIFLDGAGAPAVG
jgi:hypothetical protein